MSTLNNILTVVEVSPNSFWPDAFDDVQLSINSTVYIVTNANPLELLIVIVARPLNLLIVDDHEVEVNLEELID